MMLSERDMQELSNLSSKLAVEGYDVQDIKSILAAERNKINTAAMVDLKNYFPINKNIGIRLTNINYGFNKLTLNITTTLERISGVFDINSKPAMFEGILRNAIFNCLKNIKAEYDAEVQELDPTPVVSTVKTASATNPIAFTIASNVLYTETGSIDTAFVWTIEDIKDDTGTSIDGSGTSITATSANPLKLELSDGTNTLEFSISSGTFDGSTIIGNNVAISGGE